MSNRVKKRPGGLREALAAKTRRTDVYRLPMVTRAEAEEASARLGTVKEQLEYARLGAKMDGASVPTAEMKSALSTVQREYDEAKKAFDSCWWEIEVQGLSEVDFEALVNAHPVVEGQSDPEGLGWNRETFPYALLSSCVVADDENRLTPEEWREEIEGWPRADKIELVQLAYRVNSRSFSDGIPKG